MKRRTFFGASAAAATAAGLGAAPRGAESAAARPRSVTDNGKLAGRTLEELRKEYRFWLFDDFLPFMDKYVVDHDLGGFMCTVDRDGAQVNSNKTAWYEGRGIWTYSYLYNKLDKNPKYREIARKSKDFVLKIKPEGDGLWPYTFTKEGKATGRTQPDIYGDLFIAHGLQEFAKAQKDEQYWDLAKDIMLRRMKLYDRPDYSLADTKNVKAPRINGHWMIFLNLSNQMLEMKSDPEVEAVAARCVDAIMNYHFNPDFGLINEIISHDMSRNPETAQFSYTGHAVETLWMVMQEALRKKDRALFDLAAERFRRHVEVSHDDVYGGWFRSVDNVDENKWAVDKVTWMQEEVLIGTLMLVEHTGSQWAKDWFANAWKYANEKLALRQYGFPLWVVSGDRKVTFVRHANRCEHFHHPRHLMQNILALDRMIKRGGKVSGVWG